MNEFYEGLISGVAMLGGLCAFIYWVFNLLEKRLEMKIDQKTDVIAGKFDGLGARVDGLGAKVDVLAERLDEVILEQADQRKRTDQLYQIVIDLLQSNKAPRTNP